jgi:tetratricopeptide (TPR) repeat protein
MIHAQASPVRVFVSYAHEDRPWCDQLLLHLSGLRYTDQVNTFDDRDIEAGEAWEARLLQELDLADVIVLIVTANFLHSRFCTTVELTRALERYADDETRIVPIIADHCDWETLPLARFQALPKDEQQNLKPLSDWKDEVSKALAAIARTIRLLTERMQSARVSQTITSARETPGGESAAIAGGSEWIHPEPPDRLVGREEEVRQIVAGLVNTSPGHVVVLGPAGIGKTALTLQVATHPDVVGRFGDARCFVSLEAATSPEAAIAALYASLRLPPHADSWVAIESMFRQRGEQPALIVLDNLETPWERNPGGIEHVLARLARLPHVTLLASIRGGEAPLRPAWQYQHELQRLLSPHDRQLLCVIAPTIAANDPLLPEVLRALDGVPLAIELFAAQAQAVATLALPWQRWGRERTAMLARGANPDRLSSLDVSLRMSLTSPRMHDPAHRLFAMLGRLPRGLALEDADTLLGGGGGADAAIRLVQTRLAKEHDGRIVTLVPVREYARAQTLSPEDQARLWSHFEQVAASLGRSFLAGEHRDAVRKARTEIDNIDALIDDMLQEQPLSPDTQRRGAVLSANVGNARRQLGGLGLAVLAYQRTLVVCQGLANADPTNAEWQRDLSVSLNKIGDVRRTQGDLAGALRAYEDSRVIRERLATAEPANVQWQRDLSISWQKIADVRLAQGNLASALHAYEDSRAIAERLVTEEPANTEWQRDLSISWERIGDVRCAQGDLAGAVRAYEGSGAIRKRLTTADPANAQWQRDLSISRQKIGDLRLAQGDLASALRAHEDGRAIAERLATADPVNTDWQRDLCIGWNKVGDLRLAQGDLPSALGAYEEGRAIAERLTAADPANAEWRRDLSISWQKIGDVRWAQRDLPRALGAYEDGRAIAERLASADPANAEWQRDLTVSLNRVGDVRGAQGDLAGAVRAYDVAQAIAERLAATDPANAYWQRDLSLSLTKLADCYERMRDFAEALRFAESSLRIDERLAALDPTNATWRHDLTVSRAQVARLRG